MPQSPSARQPSATPQSPSVRQLSATPQSPTSCVRQPSATPQSPTSCVRQPSDEVFIFPPLTARQFSNSSDPPSPRSGILKVGQSPNGKFSGITGGKLVSETGSAHSPELNYARKNVRHSIVSVDSTFDLSGLNLQLPVRKRCQRRLSVYLHTHVVLIIVSSLAILDAICVIGQLISDIIIMQEKLAYFENIDDELTVELLKRLPEVNSTLHETWNLHAILQVLLGRDIHSGDGSHPAQDTSWHRGTPWSSSINEAFRILTSQEPETFRHPRVRRALEPKVPGHEVDHGALYDLTHACHLGSMAILSLLLLETLLKVLAMGTKLRHHKLEIFDALVVTISWCLDVAFWEGIWAHPGTKAATFLMYLLPWRVVRIVNSFVLVIQEKEHVHLKIVKQRLRQALRRSKEALYKAASYRHEAKAMAGMCRKLGATEQEITACSPSGKAGRRGSVQSVLERAASLTFISTLSSMGSLPSLFDVGGSSSEEEEDEEQDINHDSLERKASHDLTVKSQDSGSDDIKPEGHENKAFVSDTTSIKSRSPSLEDKAATKDETDEKTDKEETDEETDKEETMKGEAVRRSHNNHTGQPDYVDTASTIENGTRL